ncbi:MAG: hypothetical protein ABIJ43_04440 [Candidatus Beckwithbacteria bacterium]
MPYPARLKQKANNLRLKGSTLLEISRKLNIAKSTASTWLRDTQLSKKAKLIIQQKRKNTYFQPNNTHWQKARGKTDFITWTPKKLQQLQKLYHSGLSMNQVGSKMNTSVWAICSTMKRHSVKRRTSAQTNKIKFYNSPLSFSPKKNLTKKELQLKIAGLMLYWAEGAKGYFAVDFANSNPYMIKLFTKFLRKIYQVDESRLRCLIYCYPSHDINHLYTYWSNIVKIPRSQFTKPYTRQDGGNIRDKMKYGLVHIRYSDKRLLELILKEIKYLSYNI